MSQIKKHVNRFRSPTCFILLMNKSYGTLDKFWHGLGRDYTFLKLLVSNKHI